MLLPLTDLSGSDGAQERAQALVGVEAGRGFDLQAGPLLRAGLLRLGEDEHIFMLTLHHIIVDGWSIGVLNRELSVLYGAFLEGGSAELPELPGLPGLPIQYADYAAWQQEWMASGGLDEQLAYWERQLAGAPALLELPTDRPRPPQQTFRGAVVRGVLPLELLERVKALGERQGATLFMTLLTGFAVLLSRYSGQEDVVVASPVANRGRTELEGLIGLFVNTLALRVDLEGEPSFSELLTRVREVALGAFSNQDLPFEKLVEELNPERHLSYSPIAQVMFVLQTAVGEGSLELEGLDARARARRAAHDEVRFLDVRRRKPGRSPRLIRVRRRPVRRGQGGANARALSDTARGCRGRPGRARRRIADVDGARGAHASRRLERHGDGVSRVLGARADR